MIEPAKVGRQIDIAIVIDDRILLAGAAGKTLGAWSVKGLVRWQSGEPIAIVSARGTLNRGGRSGLNTVNSTLSVQELQDRTGLFFDATGRPVLFNPALISAVRANASAPEPGGNPFLTNPLSGFVGGLQLTPVSGPSVFFLDMSMIKRTNITERVNVEFRAEAFNVLNHTAFDVGQTQRGQHGQMPFGEKRQRVVGEPGGCLRHQGSR